MSDFDLKIKVWKKIIDIVLLILVHRQEPQITGGKSCKAKRRSF